MQSFFDEQLQNSDWLNDFGISNPRILIDAVHYRSKDSHKLYKELDTCQRHINCGSSISTLLAKCPKEQVPKYIKLIVYLYCHCIESIKIARAIEKLLTPWKDEYKSEIVCVYRVYIMDIIEAGSLSVDRLVALSNLLEQNVLARESVEGDVVKLLCWLQNNLSTLVRTDPSCLTKAQSQNLYALVKIGLQLFQSCSAHTCEKVWFPNGEKEVKDQINGILKSLLKILHSQHYAADCTILAGTALASLIVSAPQTRASMAFFIYVFNMVNCKDFGQMEDVHVLPYEIVEKYSSQELTCTQDIQLKLGCISLIKGIIACAPQKLLLLNVNNKNCSNRDTSVFITELFDVIHKLCSGPIHLHYHAFTLLLNWFQKLVKSYSQLVDLSPNLTLTSDLVVRTLQLVWLNWDSPVEDVAELMMNSLKCLLEFWDMMHSNSTNEERRSLSLTIHEKLRATPWYCKGRYKVMEVLIPLLKLDEITDDGDLPQQLLQCLSTNYLAPSAGDIYKAYLLLFREKLTEEDRVSVWKDTWLQTIGEGVTSKSWLVRNNIYHYWINSTMKTLPSAGLFLQDYWGNQLKVERGDNSCKTRNLLLLAFISVSKVIRGQLGKAVKDVDLLREALYHSDEDIRSEAISLLCISLKKAEPLSDTENSLLKEILPYNLKVDSAPFRQHLSANLKKLLVRIRDSCVAMLKTKQYDALNTSVEFVDWLHKTCMVNLIPGSCYQRRKASLDILYIIYDTLIYNENVRQRKAFTPASVQKLFAYVEERGCWNFFSFQSSVTLLHTLMDGADEIQESASHLLLQYYQWPLCPSGHLVNVSPESLAGHLLTTGLALCNSPKAHESQSGALLCKIIFQKYMIDLKWHFTLSSNDVSLDAAASSPTSNDDLPAPPALTFLTDILSHVKNCQKKAESNLVAASKSLPLHGYICMLTRCVSETSLLTGEQVQSYLPFLHSLVEFNIEIINFMLTVMSRGAQNEACPSFAEIGEALESYIEESETDYNTSTSLSVEHQYLLSWCWVNIKESCLSLGTLSDILIARTKASSEVVDRIKSTFLTILTKCRHRGVIEGCRSAFIKFCSALFDSSDSDMNSLPQHLLEESFATLTVTAGHTSTTRKSAGLPIIVQSVISCEKKLKKTTLLVYTLEKLFEISGRPVPPDFDDRHDLPQVHGLNILKSLFSDASLSAVLMPHISKSVMLVVDMFGSPAWAIRNAATRLFSSLVVRIFGQKKSIDDLTLNTLTMQELSSHYPELPPFISKNLDAALQRDITAIDKLHPSLFPILTLLASVGTTESSEKDEGIHIAIKQKVWQLLPSPVYYLRQLASSAYVALTSSQMTLDTLTSLIGNLMDLKNGAGQANMLHSILLCVQKFITRNCFNEAEVKTIIHRIADFQWILEHSCDILRAKYVDTISLLYKLYPSQCDTLIHRCCSSLPKVGTFPLTKMAIIEMFFLQTCNTGIIPSCLLEDLHNSDVDSAISIIKVLKKMLQIEKIGADVWHEIQVVLYDFVQGVAYTPLLGQCLTLMTDIHLSHGSSDKIVTEGLWDRARKVTDRQKIVAAPFLEVGGICIHQQIKTKNVNRDHLERLCSSIKLASEMTGSEDHRLSAARVLLVTGRDILQYCSERKEENLCKCSTQIFKTCLNLIQDDDTEIRDVAVQFVSNLHWPERQLKYNSVQCNSCLQLWLDYFCDTFYWSTNFIKDTMNMLYIPGNVQCILNSSKKGQSKQLFEQEDNSFFAERLFTGFHIGKLLMRILSKLKQFGAIKVLCDMDVVKSQIVLLQDLNYVYKELKTCNDNPLMNTFSYPGSLACVSHLLSYTCVVTEICTLTNTGDETTTFLRKMYDCIVKSEFLPPGMVSDGLLDVTLS